MNLVNVTPALYWGTGAAVMSCEAELSKLDMSDINFQNNTTNEFNYQLFNSEGWHGQSIHHMN